MFVQRKGMTNIFHDGIVTKMRQNDGVKSAIGFHRVPNAKEMNRTPSLLLTKLQDRSLILKHRLIEFPRSVETCIEVGDSRLRQLAPAQQPGQDAHVNAPRLKPNRNTRSSGPSYRFDSSRYISRTFFLRPYPKRSPRPRSSHAFGRNLDSIGDGRTRRASLSLRLSLYASTLLQRCALVPTPWSYTAICCL